MFFYVPNLAESLEHRIERAQNNDEEVYVQGQGTGFETAPIEYLGSRNMIPSMTPHRISHH